LIQVEGLGANVLEQDTPRGPVMPFLRGLATEGLYFPRVFQSFPATDGGTFATLTGLPWTHAFGGHGDRLSQSVIAAHFGDLPRLLARPGMRHYAFPGSRHRTAEFVSFTRNLGYRTVGFDALLGRLGPRAAQETGPLGVNDGPLFREAAATLAASPGP